MPERSIAIQTYMLSADAETSLYEQLYLCLKQDILSGNLSAGTRLPSKRSFSENLGVSSITVESAYGRLMDEGYVRSEPKRGYFVTEIAAGVIPDQSLPLSEIILPVQHPGEIRIDLSSNRSRTEQFPFSVWSHLLRETIAENGEALLRSSPCGGIRPLREAIASHLSSFRGMRVDPDQIIVGAGTEYLYGLLIQLLGRDRIFCLENPGYLKIAQIYQSNGAVCRWASMDEAGIRVSELEQCGADIVHISPTHHFPTGITMPIVRRQELLNWAGEKEGRFIIEDDYDSEFRLTGRPIPSLQSIDAFERVIYMNTFSKTLAPTIRISYMVLPPKLANEYYRRLSFYSCTVSTFEQYTLSRFISRGFFEKHINRMRLSYARLRKQILQVLSESRISDRITILERDSGLHFLLQLQTARSDSELLTLLQHHGINLVPISVYYRNLVVVPEHTFILNYSSLSVTDLQSALSVLAECI